MFVLYVRPIANTVAAERLPLIRNSENFIQIFMKKTIATLSSLLCSLLLFACNGRALDDFGLEKLSAGISTEADVQRAMGAPEKVWQEANGAHTLEYPKGPEGHRTFMVRLDAQGIYQGYTQVLTVENFATVKAGMSQDEIRRKLGKPRTVVNFALKNEQVWDWLYLEDATTERYFNVHFDMASGVVVRTSISDPIEG